MLKRFRRILAERRRRRSLLIIRREFAKCGYPLDGLADDEIEAALPPWTVENPSYRLGAKTISRALRRLPLGSGRRPGCGRMGLAETRDVKMLYVEEMLGDHVMHKCGESEDEKSEGERIGDMGRASACIPTDAEAA